MIIDDILEALHAFESHGRPAKSVFLGRRRMQQLQKAAAAYRSVMMSDEVPANTFLGLPVKAGDFPPDYIGFTGER